MPAGVETAILRPQEVRYSRRRSSTPILQAFAKLRSGFVHGQTEDIRARVVSHHVQVELAFGDLARVHVRAQHAFALVARSRQNPAQWTYNHAAAADPLRLRRAFRTCVLARREHEAAPFER